MLPTVLAPGDVGHIAHHEESHELLSRLDGQTDFLVTGVYQDLLANMPVAGASNLGLLRFVTDVPRLDYSDGSTWRGIPSTSTANSFTAPNNFQDDVFFGSGQPWVDVYSDVLPTPAVGDGAADDRQAFEDADAIVAALPTTGGIVYAGPGRFLWSAGVEFSNGVSLIGAGATATEIRYEDSVAVSLLKWSEAGNFTVANLGVQATAITTATKMIHLADCVYFNVENVSLGGVNGAIGQNHTTGLLIEATMILQVPERGFSRVANLLYVHEIPTVGNTVSRGVHLKGIVDQSINYVSFEGWGNVEHAGTGMLFEHASNNHVGPGWLIKGNTDYGVRMISGSSDNRLYGVHVSEDQAVGYNVAAGCEDNVFRDPTFTTTTAAAFFQDAGTRTVITDPAWSAGATSIPAQKTQHRLEMRKGDGGGPHLHLIRNATETEATLFLSDGTACGVNSKTSYFTIERGGLAIDLLRWDINAVTKLRVNSAGYLVVSNNVAPLDASLANGDCAVWFDQTPGAAKINFRARTSAGVPVGASVNLI